MERTELSSAAAAEPAAIPASSPPVDGRRRDASGRWLLLLARYGTLVGFVLMLLIFSMVADSFLTVSNLGNVLKASAALGVLAIGLTIVLILGDFDLSIGYTATAAGMLAAGTAQSFGMAGGTVAALLVGLGVGLANGLVVTRLGVSAFITTLGAGQIIAGCSSPIEAASRSPQTFRPTSPRLAVAASAPCTC